MLRTEAATSSPLRCWLCGERSAEGPYPIYNSIRLKYNPFYYPGSHKNTYKQTRFIPGVGHRILLADGVCFRSADVC